jgi:hypothetical protein
MTDSPVPPSKSITHALEQAKTDPQHKEVPDWDHDDDCDSFEDDADDGWDECGMTRYGYCTLAGSEWCDWECPRNKP